MYISKTLSKFKIYLLGLGHEYNFDLVQLQIISMIQKANITLFGTRYSKNLKLKYAVYIVNIYGTVPKYFCVVKYDGLEILSCERLLPLNQEALH